MVALCPLTGTHEDVLTHKLQAFNILVPASVFSGLGVIIFLPSTTTLDFQSIKQQLQRIDFAGASALVTGLACLLLGLNHEDSKGYISIRVLAITMPLAAVFLAVFVLIEARYAKEPIVPVFLLRIRTVIATCLSSWCLSMAMYTLMFYVPLYFQVTGSSTSETGLRMLPESIGGGLGCIAVGVFTRVFGTYGNLKISFYLAFIAGTMGFATASIGTPFVLPEIYLFLNGLGVGGILTLFFLILLSAVDQEYQAVTSSILYAFRTTGATIGIAVSSTLFRILLNKDLESANIHQLETTRPDNIENAIQQCSKPHPDPRLNCPRLMASYIYALHGTFMMGMGFAILAFLIGLLTKNYRLRENLQDTMEADNESE
jgi:hypothetical protein